MKGLFIPEITTEMFRNGCLESIEALMAEGEIYDIDYQQPCEDCISRQALLDKLEKPMNWTDSEAELQEQRDYEGFVELLKSMPSVIPKGVTITDFADRCRECGKTKTGHWIKTGDYYTGAYGCLDYFECSCCHEESLEEGDFCPNCGAKMGGEDNDNK